MLPHDLEVVVLAHPTKASTTAEMLGTHAVPFRIFENPDWDFPPDHPEIDTDRSWRPNLRGYALRQYRAFRGHQEICRTSRRPYTLVFEDDAWLRDGFDIHRVIESAHTYLETVPHINAVSLHGRNCDWLGEPIEGINGIKYSALRGRTIEDPYQLYFLEPIRGTLYGSPWPPVLHWHEGALAYLIGVEGKAIWAGAGHANGLPCDLFLANALDIRVAIESPFLHDQRHGSIINNTGNAARRLSPDGTQVIPSPPMRSEILGTK